MDSSYNIPLVTTSVVIASLASYTALDLAGRVTAAQGRQRLAWLAGGSAAMGLGIWSMHFVGMLAFQMPMQMGYDVPLVIASALIAIAASGLAMVVVSRPDLPLRRLLLAGLIMGLAIAGMHYTGMAAMRMPAVVTYDPFLFWLSICIAIGASIVALSIAFNFRDDESFWGRWLRGGSAVIMGFAIAGMHYTGMSAARFAPHAVGPATFNHTLPHGVPLAIAVIGGALLVLVVALVGTTVDRRMRGAAAEQERLRQMHDEMEQQVVLRTAELQAALVAAEQANRTKSEFLARMSHELRTPLNSVIGFANILHKNKAGNQRPQDLSYLERIGANGQHLLSLINSILDLAKIEAGHVEAEITTVPLGALVHEVVSQLEGVIRDRPIVLRTDIPKQLVPIQTDDSKLRQILVNLIGNAIKFTETGSITVRIVASPGGQIPQRIDVIDTGIGIPPDRIDAVFRPFEQADNSTTRKYGGTGLGLAITQSLCELLGATLSVTSIVGKGSTFSMLLPTTTVRKLDRTRVETTATSTRDTSPDMSGKILSPSSLDSAGEQASGVTLEHAIILSAAGATPEMALVEAFPSSLEGRLILVIDDEADARTVLSHYLEEIGCRVVTAASGSEGLRLAAEHQPDLITLDLMMAEMSGWEVLRRLKNDPALEHIPVVVVSIVASDSRGSVYGAVDLLDKPCTREALISVLRRNIRTAPIRVLLVEDDPDTCEVTLHNLHDAGNIVTKVADTGVTALQALATFVPDLILLDLMMPTMDGMAFLTHIKNDPRYASIPVVVVTAKELSVEERKRLVTQTLGIVQKGDDLAVALPRVLDELLSRVPVERA